MSGRGSSALKSGSPEEPGSPADAVGGAVDSKEDRGPRDAATVQQVDDRLVGRFALGPFVAADVHGQLELVLQLRGQLERRLPSSQHAGALQRHQPVEAELVDLDECRHDPQTGIHGDRHQRQVLRQREQPVGVQVMLDPEAFDAAHDEARLQFMAGIDVRERVGEKPSARPVALAEVDRQLEAGPGSQPPSDAPSRPGSGDPEGQADEEVEHAQSKLAVFAEPVTLQRPGAEGGEGTEQSRSPQPVRVVADGRTDEGTQHERPEQVHHKRPEGKLAADPGCDRPIDHEAGNRSEAADHAHGQEDVRAHPVTLARRTRFVANPTARKPAVTLTSAYVSARPLQPPSSIRSTSTCIVENVVSAPQKPVPSSGRR